MMEVLQEWKQLVENLIQEIARWSKAEGWSVDRQPVELNESKLGTYEVPSLVIDTPNGRLMVKPAARYVFGADGRVDLYSWPSLNKLLIVRTNEEWKLRTASGVDWPNPWKKETFLDVASELVHCPSP